MQDVCHLPGSDGVVCLGWMDGAPLPQGHRRCAEVRCAQRLVPDWSADSRVNPRPDLQFADRPKANPGKRPSNRQSRTVMLNQLLQRLFSQQPAAQRRNQSLPAELMARAEASAGTDPFHAIELRRAAIAFLGVVS